ncbi:MAG TPA: nitroreductase family protein [Thermodesulfobacteriota bacterium]|nr:nitroreductase family protein [Thermodesulfobacteriota bacterium]
MLEEIKTRRSIRKFTSEVIDDRTINQIIEMGTWAPSGLNNQPWKFVVVKDREMLNKLSRQTLYSHIIKNAPVCIAVFLDNNTSYHREKDLQAIGACLQNMLLSIHHLGLGGVWLGEILKNRKQVEKLLEVPDGIELMAVVALGHPAEKPGKGTRKPLDQAIIGQR